jgi:hypothetical protein
MEIGRFDRVLIPISTLPVRQFGARVSLPRRQRLRQRGNAFDNNEPPVNARCCAAKASASSGE